MYLIVGLGNPEPEYDKTRHNMGFCAINSISEKCDIHLSKNKFDGIYGSGTIDGKKVILLKPQTYMNLSGKSIIQFVNFYKIDIENVIVIYDDMDIDIGTIKIRKKGGAGTHNGMKSVVAELKTDEFPRVRVGIGTPQHKNDLINYVIGAVPEEEYSKLLDATKLAADATIEIIKNGIDKAMNMYN